MQDVDEKFRNMGMGRMIHILSRQIKRSDAVEITDHDGDLTVMQMHILRYILLATLERDIYQKDIEEEFQIRKSTVTGILKLMEKHGFICRKSTQRDARLKRIEPTQKAVALRPAIIAQIQKTERRLLDGITAEEAQICRNVMCRMFRNLTEKDRENKEVDRKDE